MIRDGQAALWLVLVLAWAGWGLLPGCGGSGPDAPGKPLPGAFPLAAFCDPPAGFRPWVRWWWPGGDVSDEELVREIGLLAENGFGGAEIQPFDAALNPAASPQELTRRRSFDSPSFYRQLEVVMRSAAARGLGIDLNLGSGWPTGGMHIRPEQSLKTLLWSEHALQGPGSRTVDLRRPDQPVFYLVAELAEALLGEKLARYQGERARLIAVVAGRVTGGARSGCPLDLGDHVDLDPGSVQVLTGQVGNDGLLTWDVPAGDWRVIGIYEAPDGEYPQLNAQPEPGYVLDHFDRDRVRAHLEHLLGERTGLAAFRGAPLRGFFNDSLELKAERFFAGDLLEQFRARRGYGLEPWLPAILVPGADNSTFDTVSLKRGPEFRFSGEDHRIRHDYVQTVSDLFIERFVENAGDWAAERGLEFRAQCYGLNVDTLRAAGAAQIPEAEQLYAGGSELFLKMVSSGALLYGRPVVSAESLVWLGRAYMTTPLKIKAAADKMFASGVNQVVFHGFPYSKNHDYGETGWHPFASPFSGFGLFSENVAEASPFWESMADVNRYLARCQVALRQGKPAVDVLLYYPWLGFQTTLAAQPDLEEPLLNGQFGDLEPELGLDALLQLGLGLGISEIDPQVTWLVRRRALIEELESHGFTWAWVNDDSLEKARFDSGDIAIGENRFKAVVVAESPSMQPGAAERLAGLAAQGARVLLAGRIPSEQPGFRDYQEGDRRVVRAMEAVQAGARVQRLRGEEGAVAALGNLGAAPGLRILAGGESVRGLRRELGGGARVLFLRNPTFEEVRAEFEVEGGCRDGVWVDVWNGTFDTGRAAGSGTFSLTLPALSSGVLLCGIADADSLRAGGFHPAPAEPAMVRRHLLGPWTLDVAGEDVPGGAVHLVVREPPDWRDIEALRFCSSPGTYGAEAELEALREGETAWLEAVWVHGTGEVRVNGRRAGSLAAPPFSLEVSRHLVAGRNRVELEVTPALRNRLEGKARSGDERYREFSGSEEALLPGGIRGPVFLEIRSP